MIKAKGSFGPVSGLEQRRKGKVFKTIKTLQRKVKREGMRIKEFRFGCNLR